MQKLQNGVSTFQIIQNQNLHKGICLSNVKVKKRYTNNINWYNVLGILYRKILISNIHMHQSFETADSLPGDTPAGLKNKSGMP
jgi:hypothetical protein